MRRIAIPLALVLPLAAAQAGDRRVVRDAQGAVVGTVEPKGRSDRLVVRDRLGVVCGTVERASPRLDRYVVRDRAGRVVGTLERC
jgi:hypothetical protein